MSDSQSEMLLNTIDDALALALEECLRPGQTRESLERWQRKLWGETDRRPYLSYLPGTREILLRLISGRIRDLRKHTA